MVLVRSTNIFLFGLLFLFCCASDNKWRECVWFRLGGRTASFWNGIVGVGLLWVTNILRFMFVHPSLSSIFITRCFFVLFLKDISLRHKK
ncbi:hypothetical protein AAHE18_13G305400 [Arachis hypogaea]